MFGAFARRDAIPVDAVESMVEFSPGFETYRHYLGLKWHLEEYFSTKINLITTRVLAESPAAASFDPEMGEVDQEALMQVLGDLISSRHGARGWRLSRLRGNRYCAGPVRGACRS